MCMEEHEIKLNFYNEQKINLLPCTEYIWLCGVVCMLYVHVGTNTFICANIAYKTV
jgi:hypothetical protein